MRSRYRDYNGKFGDMFFITSTVLGFIKLFDDKKICDLFIESIAFYQERGDFILLAYVIMPHHFHLVIKADENSAVSKIMANLKRITSKKIHKYLVDNKRMKIIRELESEAQKVKSQTHIWIPRFDCYTITNERSLHQKINYIHNNPLKKRYVEEAADWKYSSAGNYSGKKDCVLNVDSDWKSVGY